MHVILFDALLGAGGAERVLSYLANAWAARGWRVDVVTLEFPDRPPFFPLDPAIKVHRLDLMCESGSVIGGVVNNLRRVLRMRRCFRALAPDCIVAVQTTNGVLALLAAAGTGVPVVACERSHPAHVPESRLWRMLRRLTYPAAACVTVQADGFRSYFEPWLPAERLAVIANPVPPAPGNVGDRSASRTVLAIGRLYPEKRFDLLIRAFADVAASRPDWQLRILGSGPLREAFERQIADAGLNGRVQLTGAITDVEGALADAAFFVQTSYFEGFPNALCEALAAGLPVIATDCSPSIREILGGGDDGIVVPVDDGEALRRAMGELMDNADLRRRLGARGPRAMARFAPERILAEWDEILANVAPAARTGTAG